MDDKPTITIGNPVNNEIVSKMQMFQDEQRAIDSIRHTFAEFAFDLVQLFFPNHKAIQNFENLKCKSGREDLLDLGK